jgi:hypothetical protein
MDVITRHRLGMLGLKADEEWERPVEERLQRSYRAFLDRLPYENLSNQRVCAQCPDTPDQWPRTTDRVLRDNRSLGFGGTSFSLSYALRDLLRGLGANAHCTMGYNLVTEEAHAAVVVYQDDGPLLYDAALLVSGPVPVRPGGSVDDPLGRVSLEPRSGPTLTLTIRGPSGQPPRAVYSIIPVPISPAAFRQAWIASFWKGRARPLKLARRVGDEIVRYGERPGSLEILRKDGREERRLDGAPARDLHDLFGIDQGCLTEWFSRSRCL